MEEVNEHGVRWLDEATDQEEFDSNIKEIHRLRFELEVKNKSIEYYKEKLEKCGYTSLYLSKIEKDITTIKEKLDKFRRYIAKKKSINIRKELSSTERIDNIYEIIERISEDINIVREYYTIKDIMTSKPIKGAVTESQ